MPDSNALSSLNTLVWSCYSLERINNLYETIKVIGWDSNLGMTPEAKPFFFLSDISSEFIFCVQNYKFGLEGNLVVIYSNHLSHICLMSIIHLLGCCLAFEHLQWCLSWHPGLLYFYISCLNLLEICPVQQRLKCGAEKSDDCHHWKHLIEITFM